MSTGRKVHCGGNGYEECRTCINREHDPFQCEDCVDGDLYEPDDDVEDAVEEISFDELRTLLMEHA